MKLSPPKTKVKIGRLYDLLVDALDKSVYQIVHCETHEYIDDSYLNINGDIEI
jgi:hypothetical protein